MSARESGQLQFIVGLIVGAVATLVALDLPGPPVQVDTLHGTIGSLVQIAPIALVLLIGVLLYVGIFRGYFPRSM
jgi:xanthosine utilization system XapX-like protein